MNSQEDFQYWLIEMDDALERFFDIFPPEFRAKLDYSTASLDVIEGWMLERYRRNDELLEPSESMMLDALARYIGETFRKNIGGRWDLVLRDPKYVFYGIPQISGFYQGCTPICPFSLATSSVDRRRGNCLSTVLGNMQEDIALIKSGA